MSALYYPSNNTISKHKNHSNLIKNKKGNNLIFLLANLNNFTKNKAGNNLLFPRAVTRDQRIRTATTSPTTSELTLPPSPPSHKPLSSVMGDGKRLPTGYAVRGSLVSCKVSSHVST